MVSSPRSVCKQVGYVVANAAAFFLAPIFFFRWMGSSQTSEEFLKARLDAAQPTLFWLWTPHQFLAQYQLHRIQLPVYTQTGFAEGRTDYQAEVLEKVASRQLIDEAPRVQQLLVRFKLDNAAQEAMMGRIGDGLSALDATCEWLQTAENEAVWSSWLPSECVWQCSSGQETVSQEAFERTCGTKLPEHVPDGLPCRTSLRFMCVVVHPTEPPP